MRYDLCTLRSFHKKLGLSKARCFNGCKREAFVWITVKDGKNASCWFAAKANTDFDLKLFAAMTCWSCWHLLMTIYCLVLTPQYHNKVSFCKLSSFCRQCRGENDWKRRWKIGHSCSPYFLNIPLSAASTPASQPTQSHLPTTSSWHTHIDNSLLSSRPHVSSVYFLDMRRRKIKNKASHSSEHVLARGGG